MLFSSSDRISTGTREDLHNATSSESAAASLGASQAKDSGREQVDTSPAEGPELAVQLPASCRTICLPQCDWGETTNVRSAWLAVTVSHDSVSVLLLRPSASFVATGRVKGRFSAHAEAALEGRNFLCIFS